MSPTFSTLSSEAGSRNKRPPCSRLDFSTRATHPIFALAVLVESKLLETELHSGVTQLKYFLYHGQAIRVWRIASWATTICGRLPEPPFWPHMAELPALKQKSNCGGEMENRGAIQTRRLVICMRTTCPVQCQWYGIVWLRVRNASFAHHGNGLVSSK